jgi:hypothetical protein
MIRFALVDFFDRQDVLDVTVPQPGQPQAHDEER